MDTYRKKLSKSWINKAAWGSVVISKIEGEARTRLPADVKRDQDLEKIEEHLRFYYESSLVATKAIMQAHERSGPIPDPHVKPPGSLKVLQIHAEILEHSDRYLLLTPEETAASNLPQRVRMDKEGLSKVELDEHRRKAQYDSFKNWVNKTKQSLLEQGIQAEETHETHVSLIAGSGSRQSN